MEKVSFCSMKCPIQLEWSFLKATQREGLPSRLTCSCTTPSFFIGRQIRSPSDQSNRLPSTIEYPLPFITNRLIPPWCLCCPECCLISWQKSLQSSLVNSLKPGAE